MSEPWEETEQMRALWRQWNKAGEAPDAGVAWDDLMLAAYAEGRLAPVEAAAVDAYLAAHPESAADVAAARDAGGDAVGLSPESPVPEWLAGVIARASALVPASDDRVIAFRSAARPEPAWRFAARWSALAASFAMVSYLGFALGSDASTSVSLMNQPGSGLADELLDPPSGLFGGLAEVSGT
jgi:anti-sigma factor RsiW